MVWEQTHATCGAEIQGASLTFPSHSQDSISSLFHNSVRIILPTNNPFWETLIESSQANLFSQH